MRMGVQVFGGINQNDQEEQLINRAFSQSEAGLSQIAPLEFVEERNTDFDDSGIRIRKGSTTYKDLTTTIASINAADTLIDGILWTDPATGNQIEVIVTAYSIIWKNPASGLYAQINDSASAAYTHASVATKCSFTTIDGHLFIGLDGTDNYIQTYRSGADLDDEMTNGNTYEEAFSTDDHTITGTWTKATYIIESFQGQLAFSTGNTLVEYTPEAFTVSSGIWDLGGSTAGFLQVAGNIRSMTSFAPKFADQINQALYFGTDSGFDVVTGFAATDQLVRIEGAKSPVNHTAVVKTLNWIVYLTDDKNIMGINGASVINLGRRLKKYDGTGVLDQMNVNESRAKAYAAYNQSKSQALFAYTGDFDTVTIEGGAADTATWSSVTVNDVIFSDPIEGGAADTDPYAFTLEGGEVPTNQNMSIIDMKLGEPVPGENQSTFEQRVRNISWDFTTFSTGVAFNNLFEVQGKIIAVLPSGILYEMESGYKDLGTYNIPTTLTLPCLTMGIPERLKQWARIASRTKGISPTVQTSGVLELSSKYIISAYVAGDDFTNVGAASNATGVKFTTTSSVTPTTWTNGSSLVRIPQLTMTYKLDKSESNAGSDTWDMRGSSVMSNFSRFNRRSEDLKVVITSNDNQEWVLYSLAIEFNIGAEILK